MRRLCLLLLLPSVSAHMTTVCTATAPSACANAEVTFYFGTYHNVAAGSPGQVEITKPDGSVIIGAFSSLCGGGAAVKSNRDGSVACPAADLTTNCPTSVLPADSYISCYAANAPGTYAGSTPTTYVVADTCEAFPESTGNYAKNLAQYYATVTGAVSGEYTVRTTGTDDKLNPCPTQGESHPCGMSSSKSYAFELAVAGCGASCPSELPALPTHVVQSSLTGCGAPCRLGTR